MNCPQTSKAMMLRNGSMTGGLLALLDEDGQVC